MNFKSFYNNLVGLFRKRRWCFTKHDVLICNIIVFVPRRAAHLFFNKTDKDVVCSGLNKSDLSKPTTTRPSVLHNLHKCFVRSYGATSMYPSACSSML